MLSHCDGPQTWCYIKQTAANGGLIDCHGFSCLIYPPAIKRDNGTPPIHGAFNGTIIHKWWFFSLPCSIIGVPQITGETQTEVDTRSNVDLMEALPGGLRAAVDVSWHQGAKPQ
jgi:hypothetical protein